MPIKPVYSLYETETVMAIVDYRDNYLTVWFSGFNRRIYELMKNIGIYNKDRKLWYVMYPDEISKQKKISQLKEILKNARLVVEMKDNKFHGAIENEVTT
jgi:hypothetical protein